MTTATLEDVKQELVLWQLRGCPSNMQAEGFPNLHIFCDRQNVAEAEEIQQRIIDIEKRLS
jgi:hypothetical protein